MDESIDSLFASAVEQAIEEACEGGASRSQLDALAMVATEGEIPVESRRPAAHAAVDCISAQGYEARFIEDETAAGVVRPSFDVRFDDVRQEQSALAALESC